MVTSITSRSDPLSFDEVQSLLMTHESRLEHHLTISDLSMKRQANLAFRLNSRPFFHSLNFCFSVSLIRINCSMHWGRDLVLEINNIYKPKPLTAVA